MDINAVNAPLGMIIFETLPTLPLELVMQQSQKSIIGCPVIIQESEFLERLGNDHVPIFDVKNRLQSIIPVDLNNIKMKDILLPNDVLIKLSTESTQKYFQYNKVQIHLGRIEFFKSCDGTLCDRAGPGPECFCMEKGRVAGVGINCSIFLSTEKERKKNHKKEDWHLCNDYNSLCFLCMFVNSNTKFDDANHNKAAIVKKMRKTIDSINKTPHQWSIFGWYKQGMKVQSGGDEDMPSKASTPTAVDSNSKKVPSHEIFPHVSYLVPADEDEVKKLHNDVWTIQHDRTESLNILSSAVTRT